MLRCLYRFMPLRCWKCCCCCNVRWLKSTS